MCKCSSFVRMIGKILIFCCFFLNKRLESTYHPYKELSDEEESIFTIESAFSSLSKEEKDDNRVQVLVMIGGSDYDSSDSD